MHISDIMAFHYPAWPYPQILASAVALLISSESIGFYAGSAGFKTVASLTFLASAAHSASIAGVDLLSITSLAQPAHRFAALMVLGLLFSVFGDVLLIPSPKVYHQKAPTTNEGDTPRFKAGTFFFALAHIAYIAAFLSAHGAHGVRWVDFFVTLKFGAVLTYWLGILALKPVPGAWFAVPPDMRGLVTAYVLIIWTMVGTATATDTGYQMITGGWMFMISDLFVASDVFGLKKPPRADATGRAGWKARSIGWIAYFGAQLILAGCI